MHSQLQRWRWYQMLCDHRLSPFPRSVSLDSYPQISVPDLYLQPVFLICVSKSLFPICISSLCFESVSPNLCF